MPEKNAKMRLDQALVHQGMAPDLKEATALVMAGKVLVERQKASKPSLSVRSTQSISLARSAPFASRGGRKLEAALDYFHIEVQGLACLDLGSSTGGFTDCLLKRGAAKVWAVDVGRGQLDWNLRQDPRVEVREETDARGLKPGNFERPPDFACMDVSFISAKKLLPVLASLLGPGKAWVVLVKPQFEAERSEVKKGGLVRDPAVHQRVCTEVSGEAARLGLAPLGCIPVPDPGAGKNQEFLLVGRKTL
jgi:23S rRNA (cytidine1920-2'-O)/16S rRNA (cytidine1409-2'-O)-methyltransferase